MQLIQAINLFREELKDQYPEREITAIAGLVLEHLLNYSKIELQINRSRTISRKKIDQIRQILIRLKKNEPVQYVLGTAYFYGYKFIVDHNVLIPRQETEILVDQVCKNAAGKNNLKILDIGSGSGCIAIAVSCELNNACVYALDNSPEAIHIARENARMNKAGVQFILGDIHHFRSDLQFDYILSNPPYVRESEKKLMHPNVVQYEPETALYVSDKDPLIYYRSIADFAKRNLVKKGMVIVEINEFLAEETANLFRQINFGEVRILKDLNQKNRFLTVQSS